MVFPAGWDYRNHCSDSMTPSLMKKGADTLDRRQDNPTTCDRLLRTQVSPPVLYQIDPRIFNACCAVGHSSPGGNLSDEEHCSGLANHGRRFCGAHEFESICLSSGSNILQQHSSSNTPTAARPRSGSCASRRSQFRWVGYPFPGHWSPQMKCLKLFH